MNPENYTTEAGRRAAGRVRELNNAAFCARRHADKTQEIASKVENVLGEVCDDYEGEIAGLRKRIAELESAEHAAEQPDSIPVAELAALFRCESDAAAVRKFLHTVVGHEDALGSIIDWMFLCEAAGVNGSECSPRDVARAIQAKTIPVAELAEVLGCDADAALVRRQVQQLRLAADIREEAPPWDKPQPDADGWYKHDGRSWPACGVHSEVETRCKGEMNDSVGPAGSMIWNHRGAADDVIAWRYADGRDTGGGAS